MDKNILVKKTEKILLKTEYRILKQIHYWSSNNYGIWKYGKRWIYNTYDDWAKQLDVSKSTVRRAVKFLKDEKLILCEYLAKNKRDRTLFYAIDYQKLDELIEEKCHCKNVSPCVQENIQNRNLNITEKHSIECKNEHMYINIDNKSSKSNKSKIEKTDELKSEETEPFQEKKKPTTIQDMLQIFKKEFPKATITLTKQLCRNLVAAFKTKFDSSLKTWRRYLELIKTSTFITNGKLGLSLFWIIKFITIDRIRNGELGVDYGKLPVDYDEIEGKAWNHIDSVGESKECKLFRRKIIEMISPVVYAEWFTKTILTFKENRFYLKTENSFMRDYIATNFARKLGIAEVI